MNTIACPRSLPNRSFSRPVLAFGLVTTALLCGWTGPTPGTTPDRPTLSQRSEPLTWDIYLLFLLRVLHQMYGGDESEISSITDPVQAMAMVTAQAASCGDGPVGLVEQLNRQAATQECGLYIEAGPHAAETPYLDFLDTLRSLYIRAGGDPGTFHQARHGPESRT